MNNLDYKKFLKQFSIELIEINLFYSFIKNNNIDISSSPILLEYFNSSSYIKIPEILEFQYETIREFENTLELLIPKNDKFINGAFFTPPIIVDYIINEISPDEKSMNLDPACGSGAFILGLIFYFKNKYNKTIKSIIKENIYGIDILSYNIKRTKLLLALLGLMNNEIIVERDFNLICGDSLQLFNSVQGIFFNNKLITQFDNVIGNPPYVKFQDLPTQLRTFLSDNWESIKNGTFNLYFAFFEMGFKLLKEKGKLGFITPNNYFTSLAGEPLRNFFQNNKSIYKIIDFNHRKIFDAQTYTTLTFISKEINNDIYFDRLERDIRIDEFLNSISFSKNKLKDLNKKKWRLLKINDKQNINSIESIGTPLNKLFNINVGIATLKDELYFIDEKNENGEYYIKYYDNIAFMIEKEVTKQIYKISDFKAQEDFYNNRRRIIFPYTTNRNYIIPIEESTFKAKYPKCMDYFYYIKNELEKRDKGKLIEPFYVFGRSQGLTKTHCKIVTPTFSKYPRFTFIQSNDSLFCNGYGIFYPDTNKNSLFEPYNSILDTSNVRALVNILNSYIMHYYISRTSVSIEGNYPCYQKNFIEKFTIPNFTESEITLLKEENDQYKINSFLINKYQLNLDPQNLVW